MWSFREVTSVNGLFWGSFVGVISAANRGEFKFVFPRSLTTSPSPFIILLSAPKKMRIKTHTRVILNLLNSFHHWLCHRCLPALLYICLIWISHLTCYLLIYTTSKSRGALEKRGEESLEREFSSKEFLLPHIPLAFLSHSQHLGFVCVWALFKRLLFTSTFMLDVLSAPLNYVTHFYEATSKRPRVNPSWSGNW